MAVKKRHGFVEDDKAVPPGPRFPVFIFLPAAYCPLPAVPTLASVPRMIQNAATFCVR
jgi:hypothetical protein